MGKEWLELPSKVMSASCYHQIKVVDSWAPAITWAFNEESHHRFY